LKDKTMAYFLSPILNEQQFDANGEPRAGALISTYLAGTLTAATTYKTSTGTAQTNPIQLDSSGNYPNGTQLWLLGGFAYKFVITDSDGANSRTYDNISGVGDNASTADEWVVYSAAPTYISATSFSLAGDQTNIFQIGRRLKSTNSGGTVYSTVSDSSFAAGVTTVTVINTSGVLDSGLSQVSYGLLSAINPSTPDIGITNLIVRSYLAGCTLSTAGASATMSIAAGAAMSSANSFLMTVPAIAKTTSAWAVGTAAGGLDTGAIANSTWYHFYAIRRPDTGVTDVIFSLSASAPTLPANYTQYRRIASWRTNGSAQWESVLQDGDYFQWLTPPLDVNATNPGIAAVTRTLSVPTGINVQAEMNANLVINTSSAGVYLSDLAAVDLAPSFSASPLATFFSPVTSSGIGVKCAVRTNTSAQIRSRLSASDASSILRIATTGWFDTRGRDA
jgi:hypothetical protein